MANPIDAEQMSKLTAERTMDSLASILSDDTTDYLSDDQLADKFLFNTRRQALINHLDSKISYEAAVIELNDFMQSKTEDPNRMNLLTQEVNKYTQMMKSTLMRLQACLKATKDNFGLKVIAENYVDLNPAQGVKSKKEVPKLPKKEKSVE